MRSKDSSAEWVVKKSRVGTATYHSFCYHVEEFMYTKRAEETPAHANKEAAMADVAQLRASVSGRSRSRTLFRQMRKYE